MSELQPNRFYKSGSGYTSHWCYPSEEKASLAKKYFVRQRGANIALPHLFWEDVEIIEKNDIFFVIKQGGEHELYEVLRVTNGKLGWIVCFNKINFQLVHLDEEEEEEEEETTVVAISFPPADTVDKKSKSTAVSKSAETS